MELSEDLKTLELALKAEAFAGERAIAMKFYKCVLNSVNATGLALKSTDHSNSERLNPIDHSKLKPLEPIHIYEYMYYFIERDLYDPAGILDDRETMHKASGKIIKALSLYLNKSAPIGKISASSWIKQSINNCARDMAEDMRSKYKRISTPFEELAEFMSKPKSPSNDSDCSDLEAFRNPISKLTKGDVKRDLSVKLDRLIEVCGRGDDDEEYIKLEQEFHITLTEVLMAKFMHLPSEYFIGNIDWLLQFAMFTVPSSVRYALSASGITTEDFLLFVPELFLLALEGRRAYNIGAITGILIVTEGTAIFSPALWIKIFGVLGSFLITHVVQDILDHRECLVRNLKIIFGSDPELSRSLSRLLVAYSIGSDVSDDYGVVIADEMTYPGNDESIKLLADDFFGKFSDAAFKDGLLFSNCEDSTIISLLYSSLSD